MTKFSHNLAIAIGINQYQNGIAKLNTAKPDAETLADILRDHYQYQVELITDDTERKPTLNELENLLTKWLPEKLQQPAENNRLLFYFAGHGMALESDDGPKGFLLPQDANPKEPETFLSMQVLHDALIALPCHHLIVILDCCFAGTFRWASTRKLIPIPETIHREHYDRFIRYPAWQVITSAAHNQEALDFLSDKRGISEKSEGKKHSPFAEALFEALQDGEPDEKGRRYKKADLTKDGVITAPELYLYLRDNVENRSSDRQTPGLYPLKKHDRGEYIFHDPNFDPLSLSKADPIDETNNPYRGLKPFEEEHARFFFGRQELIESLYARIAAPDHSLTVVLGVSGSDKSSLVKAGLIPYLRELSEPETFAVNLVKVCILTSTVLDVFPKFLFVPQLLPLNSIHQWHILNPIRPGESPFAALARTIWAIADLPTKAQLDSLGFLSEKLNQKIKELQKIAEASKQQGQTSRITQRLKLETEKFTQITAIWNQNSQTANQLLIVEHFETLYALCSTETEPESEQQLQLKQVFLACLHPLTVQLQSVPNSFVEIVKIWIQKHPGVKLLLVIDQFEELITLGRKAQPNQPSDAQEEWQQFLQLLETTLAATLPQLRIIVTLRSDFEPRFLNSEALKSYWTKARFPVRAMRSDELRQAIAAPASEMALYFEPANLVDRLIDEVGQMPGALPLLSFTLSEFYIKLVQKWRNKETSDRALTIDADFDKEGGVAGSLTQRANEEYKKLGEELGEVAQQTMRRVMLRMLTLEDGKTARRRVAESELVYPNPEESDRVKQVVDRLVEARLLVKGQLETGEPYVEPAHDFLVRSWDQLQEWIKDEQEELALQQRLTIAVKDWYNKSRQEKEQQNLRNVWRQAETFVIRKVQEWQLNRERRKQKQSYSSKRSGERPIQYLWDDDPRLEQLKQILIKNNWFNRTEDTFVRESLIERQRNSSRLTAIVTTVGIGLIGLTIAALYQAQLSSLREKAAVARNRLSTATPITGLVLAIDATGQNRFWLPWNMLSPVQSSLLAALEEAKESSRFTIAEQDSIETAAFSPDGKYIATGDGFTPVGTPGLRPIDGTIWLRDLQGKPISKPMPHKGRVEYIAFSSDGKYIASRDLEEKFVKIWDLQGNLLKKEPSPSFFSISNPDSPIVYNSVTNKSLPFSPIVYIKNQEVSFLQGNSASGTSKSLSIDDSYIARVKGNLVVGSTEGINGSYREREESGNVITVQNNIINDNNQQIFTNLRGCEGYIKAITFSQNNRYLTGACSDATIINWQLQDDFITSIQYTQNESSGAFTFNVNSQSIITSGGDKTIRIWDLDGKERHSFKTSEDSNFIAVSPNGQYIVGEGGGSSLQLWDANGNRINRPFKGHEHIIESVAFSSDNKYIISGSFDTTIRLWNLEGENLRTIELAKEPFHIKDEVWSVKSVAFSSDSNYIVAGISTEEYDFSGIVQLLDIKGNPKGKPFGSDWRFALSPNGKYIAVGDANNTIQLWDMKGNRVGSLFRGHGKSITSLAFSPDGRFIASGSEDNTVRLWDTQGSLISTFLGHQKAIKSISFSPNGQYIASASFDGTVKLWPSNWKAALKFACNRLKHHPVLTDPKTDEEKSAARTCLSYGRMER